jgi:arylsulfatase B
MNYRIWFLPIVSIFVGACALPAFSKESRPNIILIVADDLGYADVGFNGAKDITTPNLDSLANNGIVCTSAYVAHPVCGPSRTALMTGRWPHAFGAQDNLPKGHPELGITLKEKFLSSVLQDTGYFTGAIGKWHLGEAPQFQPNQRGFNEFYGFLGSGHGYFASRYEAAYEREVEAGKTNIDTNISPLIRNGEEVKERAYLTDGFSREAVKFLDGAAKREQPFFLYLAYNAPHAPMEARREDIGKFANIGDKRRRVYAAMVYAVDRGVGKVVETLKAAGKFENTLIIFLSDNGGQSNLGANNAPLRGGKRDVLEGGCRVPMFIHWPAQVPTGRRFEHIVTTLDLYPTLTRLAGAKISEGKVIDGKDVWDDVMAGRNPHPDEMIYAMSHRNGYTDASGRLNEWKVCRAYQRPWKLYNIQKDIGESHDVGPHYPERLKELVDKVEKWSQTHQKPLWIHDAQQAEQWKSNSLPYFDDTFKLD